MSGVEASGHVLGTQRAAYTATIEFSNVIAKGNSEVGLECERFQLATLRDVVVSDNLEDGFDADRVDTIDIDTSSFLRNLDGGIDAWSLTVDPSVPRY